MKQESNQDSIDRPSPALLAFAVFAVGWLAWGMLFYSGWFASIYITMPRIISIPVSVLITVTLPFLVGLIYRFRFRLWHYFVWLTLIAMQLAWFSQI